MDHGARHFLVDLSQARRADPAVVSVLLAVGRRARAYGGTFESVDAPARTETLLSRARHALEG